MEPCPTTWPKSAISTNATSRSSAKTAARWADSSRAGRDSSPAWVFNLRAHPEVHVEIGAELPKPVVAKELPRGDRDRIFEIVKQRAPGFAEYETRTDRVIPVFEVDTDA